MTKSAEQLLLEKRRVEAAGVRPGELFAVHPKNGHVYVKRGDSVYLLTERAGARRIGVIRHGALELLVPFPLVVLDRAEEFGFSRLRLRAWGLDKVVSLSDINRARGCALADVAKPESTAA